MAGTAYAEADALLAEAVRQRQSGDDRRQAARTLTAAASAYRRILDASVEPRAKHGLSRVLWHLADELFRYQSKIAAALVAGREGAELARQVLSVTPDRSPEYPERLAELCCALNDLSQIAMKAGLHDERASLLEEALHLCRRSRALCVRQAMGFVLHNSAILQQDLLFESVLREQATDDEIHALTALALEAVALRREVLVPTSAASHMDLYGSQALCGAILCSVGDGQLGMTMLAEAWSAAWVIEGATADRLRATIEADVDHYSARFPQVKVVLGGAAEAMSLLGPGDIARVGGLPPEAIAATYDPTLGPQGLLPGSPAFVALLHDVVRKNGPLLAQDQARQAQREGVDWIYVIDAGTASPAGEEPPLEDLVGGFRVVSGTISEHTYVPNARYAVYSHRRATHSATAGLVHLPEPLHEALLARLRGLSLPSRSTVH
jgi:hypothetical protein